jgi:hypothetical protein
MRERIADQGNWRVREYLACGEQSPLSRSYVQQAERSGVDARDGRAIRQRTTLDRRIEFLTQGDHALKRRGVTAHRAEELDRDLVGDPALGRHRLDRDHTLIDLVRKWPDEGAVREAERRRNGSDADARGSHDGDRCPGCGADDPNRMPHIHSEVI